MSQIEINGHAVGVEEVEVPFEQRSHDLMLKSIDHVADEWIDQLHAVRGNAEKIEALVLERVARVKADITQLYLLGNAAMNEARRADSVTGQLANELLKMTELPQQ